MRYDVDDRFFNPDDYQIAARVGLKKSSAPEKIIMECACGWCGEPKNMKSNPSEIRTCPDCGASGGIIIKTC